MHNQRVRKHRDIKTYLRSLTDPKKREEYLNRCRNSSDSYFMFDENGQFIEDYANIPETMTRSSFADLSGGHASEIYEVITGKPAVKKLIARDNAWLERSCMQRMRQIGHRPQDPQEDDQTIFTNRMRSALMADPRLRQMLPAEEYTQNQGENAEHDSALDTSIRSFFQMFQMILSNIVSAARKNRVQNQKEIREIIQQELKNITSLDNTTLPGLITEKMADMIRILVNEQLNKFPLDLPGQYDAEEEAMYNRIKTGIEQNKLIAASAGKVDSTKSAGPSGEAIKDGIAGSHAYTVLDVMEREIDLGHGQKHMHKFIKMRNPWGTKATTYEVEGGRLRSAKGEDGAKGKQGFFLIELKDFMARFEYIYEQ